MTPTFIDPWQWFHEYHEHACMIADEHKQELWQIFEIAQNNKLSDIDYSLELLARGIKLAQQLSEPHWELFFEYFHLVWDTVNTDLQMVTQLLVKANQPAYQDCSMMGNIYWFVIQSYMNVDLAGYGQKIEQAIEFAIAEIPMSQKIYARILHNKAWYVYEYGNYQESLNLCGKVISFLDEDYKELARIRFLETKSYYCMGNYSSALQYAREMEVVSKLIDDQGLTHLALTWQHCLNKLLGQKAEVQIVVRKIDALVNQGIKRLPEVMMADAELYENLGGIIWTFFAMSLRFRLVRLVKRDPLQIYQLCAVYLQLIRTHKCTPFVTRLAFRLYNRAENLDQIVTEAKIFAQGLSYPEIFNEQLESILNSTESNKCKSINRGKSGVFLQP
jgi:tetratricopeptide (TPR) repeat protein